MWTRIVNDFAAKHRKARMLFLASSEKRQSELNHDFLHVPESFADECVHRIPGSEQHADAVLRLLTERGVSGECWAYSLLPEIDGRYVPLTDALDAVVGQTVETIIYFEKQGVAYYEGGHGDRLILTRRGSA